MGWSFGWENKKELVEYLISDKRGGSAKCLRHTLRGCNLWSVWEANADGFRHIHLDRIEFARHGKDWGYKSMEEQAGPFHYDCPIGYLNMVPVADENWREGVRKFHANKRRRFEEGQVVKLASGCKIPEAKIVSVRPLLGIYEGVTYRLKKNLIV